MPSGYDLVLQLTSGTLEESDLRRTLRDFAHELGWRPSYNLVEHAFVDDFANAHLVVEHGLEPDAVITFLDKSTRLADLQVSEHNRLMEISYNNLADWHLYVEPETVTYCFNRTQPLTVERRQISRSNMDSLRNEAFDQIVGKRPTPNLPSLDEALIRSIAFWKRSLSAELNYDVPNENLSALFNAVIFARAVEDHLRRRAQKQDNILLKNWNDELGNRRTLGNIIQSSLQELISRSRVDLPDASSLSSIHPLSIDSVFDILAPEKLEIFDNLDPGSVYALLSDFYRNPHAPYNYDFSIMSKHALSRIYEHYSSLLHVEYSPQTTLFPRLPNEERNKSYGSIYTPQFIARFFARFLREQMPPSVYRGIKTADPACGSGIFLRTLLELQCDPAQDGVTSDAIGRAFGNVLGLDIDENAVHATQLSLALLHLVLIGTLPTNLSTNLKTAESIEYFQNHPELRNSMDAIIVNPPFVSVEMQSEEMRQRYSSFMGEDASGRIDSYLPFLRLALEMLKPGGFGLFVLPHSFLIAQNGRNMRGRLANETWIRCLADLSAIRVFEDTGSYVMLLIFEKKSATVTEAPMAGILKVQDFVGHALEDYLEGRSVETTSYSIYEVEQREFQADDWMILPPAESRVRNRLRELPTLGDLAHIWQGIITGADDVFILDESSIPNDEMALFLPFLPDREMLRYHIAPRTHRRVFYPFKGARTIDEEELRDKFPFTWNHLSSHREKLENRAPVKRGDVAWWELAWPRSPERLLRPKIVSPHLMLLPRFSADLIGDYVVSHTAFLYPKETSVENELLRFLVAVLNSTVSSWYISNHSHKYARGYAMLEIKSLKTLPIPDPALVHPSIMSKLVTLVNMRITDPTATDIERTIEQIVAELYDLSPAERYALGVED